MPDELRNTGAFVPTTNIWEYAEILEGDPDIEDLRQLMVRLYQYTNLLALNLNIKDTGYYLLEEFNSGQQYYNPSSTDPLQNRPGYRCGVNFGALPNAGAKSVAHGIAVDAQTKWMHIYGAATDPIAIQGIPLTDGSIVSIVADATNVTITTSANLSSFTVTTVILEYCQY